MKKLKGPTFHISVRTHTMHDVRPKFEVVVDELYRQYVKHRGNIIGKTLQAPDGTTGRQMTLALTRVRERYESRNKLQ